MVEMKWFQVGGVMGLTALLSFNLLSILHTKYHSAFETTRAQTQSNHSRAQTQSSTQSNHTAKQQLHNNGDEKSGYSETLHHSSNDSQASKKILLYTYMRGGSSFLGDIFRRNQDCVYWFEHIDGFYQTEFGMKPSIKPLNIIYYVNGTKRINLEGEAEEMANYHHSIFNCNYHSTSIDLFGDSHNLKHSTLKFGRCGIGKTTTRICNEHISNLCGTDITLGKRLAPNIQLSIKNNCFKKIQLAKEIYHSNTTTATNITSDMLPFYNYYSCIAEKQRLLNDNCQSLVERCRRAGLQAVKAIRLSMELVEATLLRLPDLKFIYYVRDPRGTMSSRIARNPLLTYEPLQEAELLCQRMLHDHAIYQRLKETYPAQVMFLRYEDLAFYPQAVAEQLYAFMDLSIPAAVLAWLKQATNASHNTSGPFGTMRSNSTAVAESWRSKLSKDNIDEMTRRCREVIVKLGYDL